MSRDEIAQAMQDSAGNSWGDEAHFQRFAVLVIAAEREACAQLCERMARRTDDIRRAALEAAAENIRARGKDPMPLFDDWDKDWTE